MTLLKAVLLGIIQGVTEFLPISSSAHLVYFQHFFHLDEAGPVLAFDVALHMGTLLAVLFFFRRELREMTRDTFGWGLSLYRKTPGEFPGARLVYLLGLATLPSVIVALGFKKEIEALFVAPSAASSGLIITGILLMISKKFSGRRIPQKEGSVKDALWVGVAQAISIQPGISRSGATIVAGLFRGFDQGTAARFSFLMSIPAILGSIVFEAEELVHLGDMHLFPLVMGVALAAITGLLSIKFLLKVVQAGRLHLFAYYCFIVGTLGLIFL